MVVGSGRSRTQLFGHHHLDALAVVETEEPRRLVERTHPGHDQITIAWSIQHGAHGETKLLCTATLDVRLKPGQATGAALRRLRPALAGFPSGAVTLEAGQATQRHYHARSEEIYLIVEGRAEMELDGERRPVGPGDAILIPPGAWHELRAGDARVRLLCCCAPPYSHEDTYFA